MDLAALVTGIGAIVAAVGGVVLIVREFRRKDHKAGNAERSLLVDDLAACRDALVEMRRYVHDLRQTMADLGHDTPEPPREQR